MLDRRNVQTKRPINKLDHKKMEPFKVLQAVGKCAYKLKPPAQMKIPPVFHVSLLEPYSILADAKQKIEPWEVEEIERVENHVVREVANSKLNCNKKKLEYLILWEGFEQEDATWEPWEHLKKSAEKALNSFHKRYPKQPRDGWVTGL